MGPEDCKDGYMIGVDDIVVDAINNYKPRPTNAHFVGCRDRTMQYCSRNNEESFLILDRSIDLTVRVQGTVRVR
jgi:hypothetical protein